MSTTSKKFAVAALAGLLTAGFAGATFAAEDAAAPAKVEKAATAEKAIEKHACAGKNSCKGNGGCKTMKNACKGQNACKGNGGCATDGSKKEAK